MSLRTAVTDLLGNDDPLAGSLESFSICQVVGSIGELRPAAEIARRMVADCEHEIDRLARLADHTGHDVES